MQFFGEAVLEGLVGPFDPPLPGRTPGRCGLRSIGTDDLDVQFLHDPAKLGQGFRGAAGRLIGPGKMP